MIIQEVNLWDAVERRFDACLNINTVLRLVKDVPNRIFHVKFH